MSDFLDSFTDKEQVSKAVKALFAYYKKSASESNSLTGPSSKAFWLIIATKKIPTTVSAKPIRISIPNPFLINPEVCVFVKDPQTTYEELFQKNDINVDNIISVKHLKTEFKQFEAKRKLCASYDIFLTDSAIISMLPTLLGQVFFAKKKLPCTVNMGSDDLKREITSAINSAYLHRGTGACSSIKIGTTAQTPDQVIENIVTSLDKVVAKMSGWSNILNINLKFSDSVSLPIYNSRIVADDDVEVAAPIAELKEESLSDDDESNDDDHKAPSVELEVPVVNKKTSSTKTKKVSKKVKSEKAFIADKRKKSDKKSEDKSEKTGESRKKNIVGDAKSDRKRVKLGK